MKVSMILLTVLILNGCATDRYQIPLSDWDKAGPGDREIIGGTPLPSLCPIEVIDGRGTWSNDCWVQLERYEIISERNVSVASANAEVIQQADFATLQVIEAAKIQQDMSQIRQRLLEDEQRAHTFDNWFYRGVIALLLVGATL